MLHFLTEKRPFPWNKKGLLFKPDGTEFSHASHPCAVHYQDDIFIIAFTRRDACRRSQIFLSYATVTDGTVKLLGEPKLALRHGEFGRFDCDGAISGAFVVHREKVYLYYVGWQNLPDTLWICDTGRAILNPHELTLCREFDGPVLGRDKTNPLFAAATAFHVEHDYWQTWYNSGVRWEKGKTGWKHYYNVHYAESADGIDWVCQPGPCIPFADEYEYAFGRPTVFRVEDRYLMWFAHRATKDISSYRIGFASSHDGRQWQRQDELAGIDVSPAGWDSEMICYPSVFEHQGIKYMLYNGNGYGKTGFGLAVLEDDR
ncbi:MAG TPA: hypothetical protein PKC79_17045 [Solidesulfovibrio magneticus]|nr:hypothetical protein [Solidesulfovibrio magneticus]